MVEPWGCGSSVSNSSSSGDAGGIVCCGRVVRVRMEVAVDVSS